jgi:hypothetical protein
MDALRYSKNNYPSNSNRSLFIYFFQFDLGCTSGTVVRNKVRTNTFLSRFDDDK